ncbi:MAG: SCO family protein [Gammaproteobacteria bacterium]|nr:SCO family protein [Gammaproteobacteria bacterium]
MRTRLPVGTLALFLLWLVVVGVVALLMSSPQPRSDGGYAPSPIIDGAPLGSFELQDHRGRDFTRADMEGRWSFVFFGHTRCRDDCPAALTELTYMMRDLPAPSRRAAQLIFVTVDPAHDTPEVLATYLAFFSRAFIGLTGPPPALAAFARPFGVATGDPAADPGAVFLVEPGATVVASFPPPHHREELAALYGELRAGTTAPSGG